MVIVGLLRAGLYLLIGYLCGMWLSEHIFADLALTHWTNVWVYVWLLLWPWACFVRFMAWSGWLIAVSAVTVTLIVAFALAWSNRPSWLR